MNTTHALFTLEQAAAWIPGARCIGHTATAVTRVHTDTRTLQAGDLFVALRGDRFDGNDLIPDALARGAAAVLAHHGRIPAGVSGIEVDDTRTAPLAQAVHSSAGSPRATIRSPSLYRLT